MNDKVLLSIQQTILLKEMLLSEWCSFSDNVIIHIILRKGHYNLSNKDRLNNMRTSYIKWMRNE